ncbi:MAG: LacI family DNA-binding transcriptional regulator [Pseudomonadota bacterium]
MSSLDIARLAGVSQATVSRVLSGKGYVAEKTRSKVLKVVKDCGYRPNPFAQAMRTKQSSSVGVAVSRITNPIVPEILEALSNRLAEFGRRVVVWNTDAEGEEGVIGAIQQRSVDGVIFTAASQQGAAMRAALGGDLPVVSINRYLEDADCDQIVSTNFEGARALAKYLVASGRQRIAFINGPRNRTTLADREHGFRKGLSDAGLELTAPLYGQTTFSHDHFRRVAIEMMDQKAPPDAIACGNDLIAFAVLSGLKASGVSVPSDVWVTGFDGIEMSGWDVFDLTTMQQPLNLMASEAVEALINRIEDKKTKPRLIQFRTEFIPRGSTAHTPLRDA